jgi:hypothetical protein
MARDLTLSVVNTLLGKISSHYTTKEVNSVLTTLKVRSLAITQPRRLIVC